MEFLKEGEFARRTVPKQLWGFFCTRIPVRADLLGILIIDERFDRLLFSGPEEVPGGLFAWRQRAIIWIRNRSVPLDFVLENLVTKDRAFVNAELRLWLQCARGSEALFLHNTLVERQVMTFGDLKYCLNEDVRSAAQVALREEYFCDLENNQEVKEDLIREIEVRVGNALRQTGLSCTGVSNIQIGKAKFWSCPNDGWIPSGIEFILYSMCPKCGFELPIPCPNGHFPLVRQLKENRLCPECEEDLSINAFKRFQQLLVLSGSFI